MADEQDEQDAGEQPETHYRASAKALSGADLDDIDRWAEVAAFFVRIGVRPMVAWQRANEWVDEHAPGELPDGLVLAEVAKPKTLPPPSFLARVAPMPVDAVPMGAEAAVTTQPGKRRCLACGQYKPFPEAFRHRKGDLRDSRHNSTQLSYKRCAGCGDKPLKFKADAPPPGPHRCEFCLEIKQYPEDFRNHKRPDNINSRKCTACSEKGTGDVLEEALDRLDRAELEPVLGLAAPEVLPPEIVAPVVDLAERIRLAEQLAAPHVAPVIPPDPPPPVHEFLPAAAVLTEPPPPAAAAATKRPSAPPVTFIPRAPKARVGRQQPQQPSRKRPTMTTTRDTIIKRLAKSGCTVTQLVTATGMSEQTIGNELRAMRVEGLTKKEDGYGTPWELTARGVKSVAPNGVAPAAASRTKSNGNGHKAHSNGDAAVASVTIGAPPLSETADPFLASLLKKRADIVASAQSQVQKIDDLLAAWAS